MAPAGRGIGPPRTVPCDGSAAAVAELVLAITAALDGTGPPVLPVGHPVPPITSPPDPATAVVIATSGSVGEPKLVMLAAEALHASATAAADRLGGAGHWLLAVPAEHVAGVGVIVRSLLAGAPPAVQDVSAGFRAAEFAATAAAFHTDARRYTSLVPTQLLRLLDAGGAALDALAGFDAVLVGGAALDTGLRARAEVAGVRVVATYGMSETAGGCVYDGVPLAGVTVGVEPEPGTGGRIVLGGPTLAIGYLGRPDLTAAAFTGAGFRTGDVGRWDGGRLQVLGRADDVIVTGGENVAPCAVEAVLAAQRGVREACVVGLPDERWGTVVAAALVVDPTGPPDPDALRTAVRAALGRAAVPRVLRTVDALPLRGVGKPDRHAVARLIGPRTNR